MKPLGTRFEQALWEKSDLLAIGCDEVGRGALAGPITAAAVAFDPSKKIPKELRAVADSKLLNAKQREGLEFHIKHSALVWSVASASSKIIDTRNIHEANLLVCTHAVSKLHEMLRAPFMRDTMVLVDGRFTLPRWCGKQAAVVDGDAKVFSIAAASILAKVHRDRLMTAYDRRFPGYGFAKHKGYGTEAHRKAIREFGLCSVHRKTFCRTLT